MGWFTSRSNAAPASDCGCCENSGCCNFPCTNEYNALAYIYWGTNPAKNDEYNVYGEITTYKDTNDYCSWTESGEYLNTMSDWNFYNLTKTLSPTSGLFYVRYYNDGLNYEIDLCQDPARTDPLLSATGLVGNNNVVLKTRTELYYLNLSGTVNIDHIGINLPSFYDFTLSGTLCDTGCSVLFDGDYNDTGVLQNGYPIYFQYRDNVENNNSAYVKIWYQSGTPLAEAKLPQWLDSVLPNFKYDGAELIGTGAIEELGCNCFEQIRFLRNRYTLVTPAGSGNAANHAFVCLKYYDGSGIDSGIAITGYANAGTGNCSQNDINAFLGVNCGCITTPLISGDWHATKILTIGDGTPVFDCPEDDSIAISLPQPITFTTGTFTYEVGDAGYSSLSYFKPRVTDSIFTDWGVFRKCMYYNFLDFPDKNNFLSKANCCPAYFSTYGYECEPREECFHDNEILRSCGICLTNPIGGSGNFYAQVVLDGFQNQLNCGDTASDVNGTWIFEDFTNVDGSELCMDSSGNLHRTLCVGYQSVLSDGMYFQGKTKYRLKSPYSVLDENCQVQWCDVISSALLFNFAPHGNECPSVDGGYWPIGCDIRGGCNKYVLVSNAFEPCEFVQINKKRICARLTIGYTNCADGTRFGYRFILNIPRKYIENDPVINNTWTNPAYDYNFPTLSYGGNFESDKYCGQPIRCTTNISAFYNGYCTQYSNSQKNLVYYYDNNHGFSPGSDPVYYEFFGWMKNSSGDYITMPHCTISGAVGTGELMKTNDFLCHGEGGWYEDYTIYPGHPGYSIWLSGYPTEGYMSPASTTGILPTIEVTFNA